MRYTILLIASIFLFACSSEVKDNSAAKQKGSTAAQDSPAQISAAKTQDSSLFGDWAYEEVPDNKGASAQDQMTMAKVFGDTKLSLSKDEYTISMMGTMDTGTWFNLDANAIELKSSSGKTQKVSLKKVSDNEMIFTFLGSKDLQMKKQ